MYPVILLLLHWAQVVAVPYGSIRPSPVSSSSFPFSYTPTLYLQRSSVQAVFGPMILAKRAGVAATHQSGAMVTTAISSDPAGVTTTSTVMTQVSKDTLSISATITLQNNSEVHLSSTSVASTVQPTTTANAEGGRASTTLTSDPLVIAPTSNMGTTTTVSIVVHANAATTTTSVAGVVSTVIYTSTATTAAMNSNSLGPNLTTALSAASSSAQSLSSQMDQNASAITSRYPSSTSSTPLSTASPTNINNALNATSTSSGLNAFGQATIITASVFVVIAALAIYLFRKATLQPSSRFKNRIRGPGEIFGNYMADESHSTSRSRPILGSSQRPIDFGIPPSHDASDLLVISELQSSSAARPMKIVTRHISPTSRSGPDLTSPTSPIGKEF
ncbi:hypothetical protein BASA50_010810 [Batrachochytrium salamandrivorans]|uniref:Mid2 domain-containing protein n=1 Tax=Batrachochytrium salamandrivorans TaxID=1357716 RepID=A0ABQ8EYE8_9FUNG|nr:hypothetical protein BASA60_000236 [Batrachochytrium salamandrivorans]KAH6573123.1 hypothetical protein BASA62_003104 [Batrachochytrium salamandrivorans]KAH6579560.1 hypothetical protein BASA61_010150 [Batrachochytrium salamandrivorans]KAH6588259.1 hypothetical protein BASA50_010810 [Batrachochytrium salamandrivorans]KAH9267197.1 hypothetical protein BASA83_010111 [Batrachochytrium salamandrivorans]